MPGVPQPRPNPSEAQKRHCRRLQRAAWRGGRDRPVWRVLQFYLDEARPLLREYAAAIGAGAAAVEFAELELVRRALIREILRDGVVVKCPDGTSDTNPALGHLVRVLKRLRCSAEEALLTRKTRVDARHSAELTRFFKIQEEHLRRLESQPCLPPHAE